MVSFYKDNNNKILDELTSNASDTATVVIIVHLLPITNEP